MFNINQLQHIPRRIRKMFYLHYNRLLFRCSGIKYGKNLNVFNTFYLYLAPKAKIVIGDNFMFSSGDAYNPMSRNIRGMIFVDRDGELTIGNDTGISSSSIRVKEKVVIGNRVKVGADCIIIDTDSHSLDWRIRASHELAEDGRSMDAYMAKSRPIIIDDDVLIGVRSIITKGVHIGAHSVIGAGSIVTHDIPADCIAAGNPAKVIKQLKPLVGGVNLYALVLRYRTRVMKSVPPMVRNSA